MCTAGRHLGLFPEVASHWNWLYRLVQEARRRGDSPRVLNLFGYTGLARLAAAAAGAQVTHVDASRKAVQWARENARGSGLEAHPIRWLVDDAWKFVLREVRQGRRIIWLHLRVESASIFRQSPVSYSKRLTCL